MVESQDLTIARAGLPMFVAENQDFSGGNTSEGKFLKSENLLWCILWDTFLEMFILKNYRCPDRGPHMGKLGGNA